MAGGADFTVGQLEEEVDRLPFAGQGVLGVEVLPWAKVARKVSRLLGLSLSLLSLV